jgi:plastocyanin/streptogramin lyase
MIGGIADRLLASIRRRDRAIPAACTAAWFLTLMISFAAHGQQRSLLPSEDDAGTGVRGRASQVSVALYQASREHVITVGSVPPYYDPQTLTVRLGDVVHWVNPPLAETHGIRELSDNEFEGILTPGTRWTHRFVRTGEFDYGCRFHPWMRGHVSVLPPQIRTTDLDGAGTTSADFSYLSSFENGVVAFGNGGKAAFLFSANSVSDIPLARPIMTGQTAVSANGRIWLISLDRRSIVGLGVDGTQLEISAGDEDVAIGALSIGGDGQVWLFDERTSRIGRLRLATRTTHWLTQQLPMARIQQLVAAADALFVVGVDRRLSAFDQTAGRQLELSIPAEARVQSVIADGSRVWYADTARNKLGEISGGQLVEYSIPSVYGGVAAFAVAPDHSVWFVGQASGRVGRLAQAVVNFELSGWQAPPTSLAFDPSGYVWLGRPGRLAYFSTLAVAAAVEQWAHSDFVFDSGRQLNSHNAEATRSQ